MAVPFIPWPGRKRVNHVKQLQTGSRTAASDCGPASDLMALMWASGADIRIPQSQQKEWIAALRSEMVRGSTWPATTLQGQRAALTSDMMRGVFLAHGKMRPANGVIVLSHDDCIDLLKQGRSLVVAINYGTLNDLMPQFSGSRTFRGGHAIMMGGHAQHNGAWTRKGDPLLDGRRQGIPRGWQTVKVRTYLRAAETWGSPKVGKGKAAVIWLSPAQRMK